MNFAGRFFLILALILGTTGEIAAQEIDLGKIEEKKSVDTRKDMNANNLFMIIFFARKSNVEAGSSFGHAYVATLEFQNDSNSFQPTGVFGLYPKDGKKWALGRFDGGVDLTDLDSAPDAALLVWVNKDAYQAVIETREKWDKEGAWIIALKDCVSMMAAVAQAAGLKAPDRSLTDFPYEYLAKLMSAN